MVRDIAERFKRHRQAAGLSLRDVEKLIGVSFSSLARLERKLGTPVAETQRRVIQWLEDGTTPGAKPQKLPTWHHRIEARIERLEKTIAALLGSTHAD